MVVLKWKTKKSMWWWCCFIICGRREAYHIYSLKWRHFN